MTLTEALLALVRGTGISAYAIDCPDKGTAVLLTPYMATSYDGLPAGEQRFQIYVAADSFTDSEDSAWAVFKALEGASVPACDRQIIGKIRSLQEPWYLDKDAAGRYIHTFNIAVSAVWKGE